MLLVVTAYFGQINDDDDDDDDNSVKTAARQITAAQLTRSHVVSMVTD